MSPLLLPELGSDRHLVTFLFIKLSFDSCFDSLKWTDVFSKIFWLGPRMWGQPSGWSFTLPHNEAHDKAVSCLTATFPDLLGNHHQTIKNIHPMSFKTKPSEQYTQFEGSHRHNTEVAFLLLRLLSWIRFLAIPYYICRDLLRLNQKMLCSVRTYL
jgi:hypothetical protein